MASTPSIIPELPLTQIPLATAFFIRIHFNVMANILPVPLVDEEVALPGWKGVIPDLRVGHELQHCPSRRGVMNLKLEDCSYTRLKRQTIKRLSVSEMAKLNHLQTAPIINS